MGKLSWIVATSAVAKGLVLGLLLGGGLAAAAMTAAKTRGDQS